MFFFLMLVFAAIAIILGLSIGVIKNRAVNKRIISILKQHHCTPVSISHTHKTFRYQPAPAKLNWKNFTTMQNAPAQTTMFKEVIFQTADHKKVTSLVAVNSTFMVTHDIFFEIDLDGLLLSD